MIKIDNKYHLESDGFKGVALVLQEERKRNKIDKKTRKETGEVDNYTFKDSWYFPNGEIF